MIDCEIKDEAAASDTMRCRISWEFRDESKRGHGQPILTFDEAAEWAEFCNKRLPHILHWVEPCHFTS